MAKIVIDDREIEAPEGAPVLEVCRQNGVYVSSLCYIDGLPPYAGCRMCLVEIEGARGLQLACNSRVTDGMIVRTQTGEVKDSRRAVLSLILSNHSDRCLTCHRTEHCRPGDICLRDDVVTHRCITCSKNYRCELQTTCDLVGMAEYEPWYAEERSYYAIELQPPADRQNPFLEFDPQMCILCARCVRACSDIRHTDAITLAGRGYDSHIAFGAGGAVEESDCDFCGACIDVCPTATLMEHPHKWVAKPDKWTPTTCTSCSVGCNLQLGTKDGAGVIVKPGEANPFSGNQVCVRGRYGYDAVDSAAYVKRALVRRGENAVPVSWDEAAQLAVSRLREIAARDGGSAIGFLGSPRWTTEENLALAKVAAAVGSPNLDYTNGDVAAGVAAALTGSFGSEALPASLTQIGSATVIVAVTDDLEQTHQIAALRMKDAVVKHSSKLIVIGAVRGELDDFATVSIRSAPGGHAQVLEAIGARLLQANPVEGAPAFNDTAEGVDAAFLDTAAALLAPHEGLAASFVYAMPHFGAVAAAATTTAMANLAVLTAGAKDAATRVVVLPNEANTWGLRDAGIKPGEGGETFAGMIEAAREGRLKALVVAGDNPLHFAADKAAVRDALDQLELLIVLDGMLTDTARLAHIFLPTGHQDGHEGTFTTGDRFLSRVRPAIALEGDQHPAYATLATIGIDLGAKLPATPSIAAGTLTATLPGYKEAAFDLLGGGSRLTIATPAGTLQPVLHVAGESGALKPVVLRTLFTSYEASAIHSPDADRLHREENVLVSATTAAGLGAADGDAIPISAGQVSIETALGVSEEVPDGVVVVPLHIQGGLGAAFGAEGVDVQVRVAATA